MPVSNSGVIGVALTRTDATALFPVGTIVNLSDGGQAIYVQGLSEISTYAAVLVDASSKAQMTTTTLAVNNKRIAFAQTSIASAYFGWVQMGGTFLVNCAANCAPNVPLFTTATSGVLDDATVSAAYVQGIVATNTISNATAITCVGAYPHVTFYGSSP